MVAPLNPELDVNACVELCLKCGEVNIRAMELLDAGNTEHYGHPVPTKVPLGHRKGKAILVSGHDLLDLEALLKQTEGKGITVYTPGEMLPAHATQNSKVPHFYALRNRMQKPQREFPAFPGAILMTTNCIQKPQETYQPNIFTTGPVGWPGVTHVSGEDFAAVINKARNCPDSR